MMRQGQGTPTITRRLQNQKSDQMSTPNLFRRQAQAKASPPKLTVQKSHVVVQQKPSPSTFKLTPFEHIPAVRVGQELQKSRQQQDQTSRHHQQKQQKQHEREQQHQGSKRAGPPLIFRDPSPVPGDKRLAGPVAGRPSENDSDEDRPLNLLAKTGKHPKKSNAASGAVCFFDAPDSADAPAETACPKESAVQPSVDGLRLANGETLKELGWRTWSDMSNTPEPERPFLGPDGACTDLLWCRSMYEDRLQSWLCSAKIPEGLLTGAQV